MSFPSPASGRSAVPATPSDASIPPLVERLFRTEYGRLVALLTRLLGPSHLELAEDVTQEALLAAMHHWPLSGVPANPSAWLLQVARRKALDAIRRDRALAAGADALAADGEASGTSGDRAADQAADELVPDDQLRMIFLCCNPGIALPSRVALTLRIVGGFGVDQIASALLTDERAVAQRLVRAKRALRDFPAILEMPAAAELPARLEAVLEVLYLMFAEGHTANDGDALMRRELCGEALRLVELLLTNKALADPGVRALAALFCFQASRLDTRTGAGAELVQLADQDRGRWDRALIARGLLHFDESAAGDTITPYHLEAEIASCHAVAASWSATDWPRILGAYNASLALTGSPVVAVNRVVAVREVHGAGRALGDLDAIPRSADPWARVAGEWRGEGTFLGGAATATLRWEPVLSGQFHRVTQRIAVRRGESEMVFEGHGYYVAATADGTSGTWFDIEGHTYALDVRLLDDAIDSRWGPAGASPVGHTVYRVSGAGLVVVDSMRTADGGWREFGRINYGQR